MALIRLFMIVCTKHSAWPLDYALVGDVILCCMPHLLIESLNSCDVNCVPLSETIHLGTPISLRLLWDVWLHSLRGDPAVFWQWGTNWSNQQLEDNACSSIRTDLDQVVSIHLEVFQQTAVSPSVAFLQTLHRCHIYNMWLWCPHLFLASRLSL